MPSSFHFFSFQFALTVAMVLLAVLTILFFNDSVSNSNKVTAGKPEKQTSVLMGKDRCSFVPLDLLSCAAGL